MTIDVGVSNTLGQGDLNAPHSWRSLPYDAEFATTTWTICGAGLVLWTFLFFVGCHYHPIPSSYKKKMSDYDKLIWRFRVINAYHGITATVLSMYWYYAYFTTE